MKRKNITLLVVLLTSIILVSCGNKEDVYYKDLQKLATKSYELAIDSESVGIKYLDVWKTTIFDKKVLIGDNFYTDFNVALSAQKLEFTANGDIENIETKSKDIKKLYKDLKDKKTKKYSEEFQKAKELYLKSVEFRDVCLEPSGSYNSYSENFSTKRDELSSMYSSLKIELDIE